MHFTKDFHSFFYDSTNLNCLYTKHTLPSDTQPNPFPNTKHDTLRNCLPFRMFKTVFKKLHDHSHRGLKITSSTFSKHYLIPYLDKWLPNFIHDCLECQGNKHFNMKIQAAPTQSFSEQASSFNYRISMDTKGSINPPSQTQIFNHDIVDAFSHFVATVPIKSNNPKTAVKTLSHAWITKCGLPTLLLIVDQNT